MTKIIKEFHKDMTFEQVIKWMCNDSPSHSANWLDLICHMETKFENMQEEIDALKNEARCSKKDEKPTEFKVGWVYKDLVGNKILIGVIDNKEDVYYAIKAINLTQEITEEFTKNGLHSRDNRCPERNLIISTGEKWEPYE